MALYGWRPSANFNNLCFANQYRQTFPNNNKITETEHPEKKTQFKVKFRRIKIDLILTNVIQSSLVHSHAVNSPKRSSLVLFVLVFFAITSIHFAFLFITAYICELTSEVNSKTRIVNRRIINTGIPRPYDDPTNENQEYLLVPLRVTQDISCVCVCVTYSSAINILDLFN